MGVLRSIVPPVLGALLGWLVAEPFHDDFSWGRDWALITLPVVGIIFISWVSPYIIHQKWKLLREDFKFKKLFVIPLAGVALVFWAFEWFVKDNTPRDFEKNHVVLCLDASGSMEGHSLNELKKSVDVYLTALKESKSTDMVACVAFQSEAWQVSKSTQNYKELQERIQGLEADGSTNMSEGLYLSYQTLNENSEISRPMFILVSDGAPNNRDSIYMVIEAEKQIPIVTIGVGESFDRALLQEISEQTDGRFYSARNIDDLPLIFVDIAKSGITQPTWVDDNFIKISIGFRLLFWSLLGAVIGIALGQQTSQSIMQAAVLLGGVVGGALSALAFLALDALHVNGSTMRMLTFALFGLIVGLSIFYVQQLFRQFSNRIP